MNVGPVSAGYKAGNSKCNVKGGRWFILLHPDIILYVESLPPHTLRRQLTSSVPSGLQCTLRYPLDFDASQANSLLLHILCIVSISSLCSVTQRASISEGKQSILNLSRTKLWAKILLSRELLCIGGAMKLFVVIVYVIYHSFVDGQSCVDLPSLSIIENDLHRAVNSSGDLQTENTFSLGEIFYNCITYGSSDGSNYRELTITARYQIDSGSSMGQILYACVNQSGTIRWISNEPVLKTGSTMNNTQKCNNCREISSTTCTGQSVLKTYTMQHLIMRVDYCFRECY